MIETVRIIFNFDVIPLIPPPVIPYSNDENNENINYVIEPTNANNIKAVQPRSLSRTKWTSEEDEKLLNHVNRYGPKKWKQVAEILQTKTDKQCRDHYYNVLDPHIKSSLWTQEEEEILVLKFQQMGPKWSQIKQFLPGRTTGTIKNYMNLLLQKERARRQNTVNEICQNDLSNYTIESLLNN